MSGEACRTSHRTRSVHGDQGDWVSRRRGRLKGQMGRDRADKRRINRPRSIKTQIARFPSASRELRFEPRDRQSILWHGYPCADGGVTVHP
jgi:hypothetical protein